ncbi:MAG: hypothetical protein ACLUE1_03150 [Adlercreutzia equolifaciens]
MAETNKTLRLTQVKSAIGRKPNQGRTLRRWACTASAAPPSRWTTRASVA